MTRVAIWSVLEEDQQLYAVLFPSLWLVGTLYHAYLRFWVGSEPEDSQRLVFTIIEFITDIGIVGLSAAILALMLIAARRAIMALFDWANRDKTRAAGIEEGREEVYREWDAWNARRIAAEKEGREFTEPPPSRRRNQEEVQVA